MRPSQFLFLNNLALQYRQLSDYDKSIETFNNALKMQNLPQIWNNLGGVYGELHDLDNAELCFKTALELDPNFSASHVDLAFCHHLRGDSEKGFEEYEWRFDFFPQLKFYVNNYDQSKKWDGIQSLNGKTILLYGEQGLGDTIHFIRYVPKLKELGAKILVHCPESLNGVISRCEGVDGIINRDIVTGKGDEFPEYDYQCSMISLPHLLKCVHMKNKIYIKPKVVFNSKEQYPDTFNIGIAWAGSPAHPNDAVRSLKLKYFKPIHDIPGVKLFNLQFDMRQRMYRNGITNIDLTEGCDDLKIVDMTNMIQTFDDTATIISGLDLIISCDTALVHLAGAMNVPCWVLISRTLDWRWGLEGSSTHWYDSLKLFRQSKRDDWASVIEEVKGELSEIVLQNK
jgi:tetratricopeptide (TPR) repeat protein